MWNTCRGNDHLGPGQIDKKVASASQIREGDGASLQKRRGGDNCIRKGTQKTKGWKKQLHRSRKTKWEKKHKTVGHIKERKRGWQRIILKTRGKMGLNNITTFHTKGPAEKPLRAGKTGPRAVFGRKAAE